MDADRALVARLAAIPERLATVARAASPEPPAPGEWSPTEVVRHLIAVEREVWHSRLDQLAVEDHPHWPWAEPGPWPGEPDAGLEGVLAVYAAERALTIDKLTALDWSRTGTHETFGTLDVAGLMTKAIDHDDEHVAGLGGAS
jgi:hypothetical protein